MRGVRREVGHRDAGADHRGLVADHVDAAQQRHECLGVTHVDAVRVVGGGTRAVRLGDQQVDADHLVAVTLQLLGDGSPDEPGRAGEQDPHCSPGSW